MMKQGRLGYNSSNGRYGLLSSDLWIDTGFHCGEGLEVLVGDEWVQTRMEMNGCRKCFYVTFDKSNKTAVSGESFLNIAMSGVNKNYVPYLALKQKRGEKIYDETNNQWHDRSRFTGS